MTDDAIKEVHILREDVYRQQLGLPLYLVITNESRYDMTVNHRYIVKMRDEEEGYDHYLHEAIALGFRSYSTINDIPPMVMALLTEEKSASEAKEKLHRYEVDHDEIHVIVMLRLDKTKEFVLEGLNSIESDASAEKAAEGSMARKKDIDRSEGLVKNEIVSDKE